MDNNSSETSLLKSNTEIVREIHELVRSAESINKSLPELIENLKFYFNCEAFTIFGVDQSNRQLYSINHVSDSIAEIRVDISLNNLAGYVAGTGSSLNIANVKDIEELAQYHPQLAHGSKWEEILEFTASSMIVVPIPFNRNLIGILEVINKKGDEAFSAQDLKMAQDIAPALGMVLVRFYNDNLLKDNQKQENHLEAEDHHISEQHEDSLDDDKQVSNNDYAPEIHLEDCGCPPVEQEEDSSDVDSYTGHQQNTLSEDDDYHISEQHEDNQDDDKQGSNNDYDLEIHLEDCDNPPVEQEEDREYTNRRNANRRDSDKEDKIREIALEIHDGKDLAIILAELKESILENFDAADMTLYNVDTLKNEIYSTFQSRKQSKDIRLPLAHSNIAGHVAMAQQPVNIANAENLEELKSYHTDLGFDFSEDDASGNKTSELLAFPLMHDETLMGVLKITNKVNGGAFTDKDEIRAGIMAKNLAYAISKQESTTTQKATKFSYLIDNNLITEKVLASSLAYAESNNIDMETVLIDSAGLKRNCLGLSLENFFNLPYYGFEKSIVLPHKILGGLNKNFLAKNFWLPIHADNSKVIVLINDPGNLDKVQNIKHIFPKREIEFQVGLKVDIIDFLSSILEQDGNYLEPVKTEEMSSLLTNLLEESDDAHLITQTEEDDNDSSDYSEGDNAIIRLVNKVLLDAYEKGISDIHIEPGIGKDNVLIRFRKDGECAIYEEIPFLYKNAITSRIKIMAQLDIAERRIPQDGKFKIRSGRTDIEFRVATCPTVGENEDIVLRILAKSEKLPLEKMNFSEQNIQKINNSLSKPYGLILVVGPTGSGKTTTLHSCLGSINTPKKKIWTVEDPVEITQKGIRQVQTIEKKGLNFARAMRSFLRGDPDVIMVGEMRDTETASIGLEASLTGHLVFSTLHTNSAPETVTRLLDMGMNPLNFADSLLLVVAQRLVKTLCKNCCADYHPTQEEFDTLVNEYGKQQFHRLGITYDPDLKLKKPVGCKQCSDSGYTGRTAIHEVLEGTPTIKRMVVKKASAEELRTEAIEEGMSTLKQDGIQKVFKGDCDLKQVLAVCII